jgi:hypothetical protein
VVYLGVSVGNQRGWLALALEGFPNVGRPAFETVISEQAVITGVTQTN